MIWRFSKHRSEEDEERAEQKAQKLVAYTFFILGAYVLIDASLALITGEEPEKSLIGIVIAVLSLLIMPSIALAKYRLGKQIKSRSLVADSKQTFACVIMSVTLLLGVGLNYLFGFWWADPVAGIAIALLLFNEGKEALENDGDE
jgi:divalent metal cation (Fe/Co/Zn/Cd) transporter